MTDPTSRIKHVVVMMFENRSFDSMLGFLYKDNKNKSPLGHPFEGLTGNETNPDGKGNSIQVFPIDPDDPNAYFMPNKDPGEGFANTNFQLFGAASPPYPKDIAKNQGFVRDFECPLNNAPFESEEHPYAKSTTHKASAHTTHDYKSDAYKEWYKKPSPSGHASKVPELKAVATKDIMGMHTPETLPILSGLAKGYAVCDHWYCAAPTETLPNRAFTHMGTSQGYLYDEIHSYSAKSIFKHLADNDRTWGIFGNNGKPYTVGFCQDIQGVTTMKDKKYTGPLETIPAGCSVGCFDTFKAALTEKTLPDYTFLEPIWGSKGNSQHPNYNVAAGEQYLLEIYNALKESYYWEDTLLVITYDEHGGCYDHITPPDNAVSPPAKSEAFGFDFTRYGVRVPAVLISPWIEAGTVHRTKGDVPIDHTSILATLEEMFALSPLTERDKAAPHLLDVLTLSKPRTDDPLKGVKAPVANPAIVIQDHASQIQQMHAATLTDKHNRETGETKTTPDFKSDAAVKSYIETMHDRYYS